MPSPELKHSLERMHRNSLNEKSTDINFQPGVQKAEAITLAWSMNALIVAYVVIWRVYFVPGIVTRLSSALMPFVASDFAAHSLLPTTSILSQVIGGVTNLCIAKIWTFLVDPMDSCYMLSSLPSVIGLVSMLAWKDMNVKGVKQNKGAVV
ncbi:hypothetical protein VTL71DRAFT_1652 [Oculimacula yallundae]|uniref:Solute carrier family 40 protein n=1 Tax=Oculimacula yallundae TaxID=86028 RepID=A0ABR4CBA5_9HELO